GTQRRNPAFSTMLIAADRCPAANATLEYMRCIAAAMRVRAMTRENPTATLSDTDAEMYIALIESQFGAEWLGMPGDHPLRVLWRRHDISSTQELLTLGSSIRTMLAIAPMWTSRQIKLAKKENHNQSKGAFFEIIGLSAFASAGHKVTPAPDSNPGYDAL